MTQEAAMTEFLGRTGLPVYAAGEVPAQPPAGYITLQFAGGLWGQTIAAEADLWLTDDGQTNINALSRRLLARLDHGGCMLPCDGGALWVTAGSPAAAALTDSTGPNLRRRRVNLTVRVLADTEGETI